MQKTIARMLYKACPRCQGDLVLDEYDRLATGALTYECLQCGRTTRIEQRVEQRQPIAA
jgi:DNA-directed RNA polymerase subunit RPC12/RpoP